MAERIMKLGDNHKIIVDDTANTWKLQFYDNVAGAWKDIISYDTANQKITSDVDINKSVPASILRGTETNAKTLAVRENAGVTEIYDESAGSVVLTIESHQARHQNGGADEIASLVGLVFKDGTGDTIEIREDANNNIEFYNTTDAKTVFTINQDTGVIVTNDGTGSVDGVATTAHQSRHASGGADEISGLAASQMSAGTIKVVVPIPIPDSNQAGLAADSTGPKWTSDFVQKLDPQNISSATIRASWTASTTVSVTAIEVYDETAASVLGSASGNEGTDAEGSVSGFTAGNAVVVRASVTTASATTGATTDITYALLEITYAIS